MDYILLYGQRAVGIFSSDCCVPINNDIERYNLKKIQDQTVDFYKEIITRRYSHELLFALYLDDIGHMKINHLYYLDDDQEVESDWFKE